MFVEILTDIISSLTMHFINQFSKQTRWLWWKNQMYITGKKLFISEMCYNSIILRSIIVENVDPVASELSLGNLLKMFQIKLKYTHDNIVQVLKSFSNLGFAFYQAINLDR